MTAGVGLNGQINVFKSQLALSSARWCPGMGAPWLYRKSSSLQCLSNLFLNVLTFGAVTKLLTLRTQLKAVPPRPLSGDMTRMQFN